MIDYVKILVLYYPNDKWTLNGDDYDGLVWLSDTNKPTKEKLDSYWNDTIIKYAKINCKTQAKELISKCDWSVLPDVNLQNKSDFESYRSKLRELIVNPIENPVFPIEPDPIWSK